MVRGDANEKSDEQAHPPRVSTRSGKVSGHFSLSAAFD